MRFFLDHDGPADLALLLRSRGHEAVRFSEVLPPDTPDAALWARACTDGRIVITCIGRTFSPSQRPRKSILV